MRKRIIIGMTLSILVLTGCSKSVSASVETTTIEATTEATTEAETESLTETSTANETTAVKVKDIYGEFGKEAFDALADLWVSRLINDEAELRDDATTMFGAISPEDFEDRISEILAMERDSLSEETKSTTTNNKEVQAKPQETKSVTTETNPVPAETNPSVKEPQAPPETQAPTPTPTAPPETQAPTPTAPPVEDSAMSQEEFDRISAELGIGQAEGSTSNRVTIDRSDEADWEGANWN